MTPRLAYAAFMLAALVEAAVRSGKFQLTMIS